MPEEVNRGQGIVRIAQRIVTALREKQVPMTGRECRPVRDVPLLPAGGGTRRINATNDNGRGNVMSYLVSRDVKTVLSAGRPFAWALSGVLIALAPQVRAQQIVTEPFVLEEIFVTAQKREESLQDVPLSVMAVSGEKLADAGIVRMDDLKAYVPNLQMTETGIANNIYIRGIGSGLNQGFEQSVSSYMDGIYRGRGHQSRMPFLDLARIEVLRGPQPAMTSRAPCGYPTISRTVTRSAQPCCRDRFPIRSVPAPPCTTAARMAM
jgi:hypothetical protein